MKFDLIINNKQEINKAVIDFDTVVYIKNCFEDKENLVLIILNKKLAKVAGNLIRDSLIALSTTYATDKLKSNVYSTRQLIYFKMIEFFEFNKLDKEFSETVWNRMREYRVRVINCFAFFIKKNIKFYKWGNKCSSLFFYKYEFTSFPILLKTTKKYFIKGPRSKKIISENKVAFYEGKGGSFDLRL